MHGCGDRNSVPTAALYICNCLGRKKRFRVHSLAAVWGIVIFFWGGGFPRINTGAWHAYRHDPSRRCLSDRSKGGVGIVHRPRASLLAAWRLSELAVHARLCGLTGPRTSGQHGLRWALRAANCTLLETGRERRPTGGTINPPGTDRSCWSEYTATPRRRRVRRNAIVEV